MFFFRVHLVPSGTMHSWIKNISCFFFRYFLQSHLYSYSTRLCCCDWKMAQPLLEEEEVNPVRHRLNFSTTDYIRTLVLGITLLPFRLFGLLACFVAAWAVASVGQVRADLSRPLAGWQALARRLVAILGRLSMVFCGIHWVQVDLLDLIQSPACVSGGGETMLQGRGACSRCCSSQVIS